MTAPRRTIELSSGRSVEVRMPVSSRPLLSPKEAQAVELIWRGEVTAVAALAADRITREFVVGPVDPPLAGGELWEVLFPVLRSWIELHRPDVLDA